MEKILVYNDRSLDKFMKVNLLTFASKTPNKNEADVLVCSNKPVTTKDYPKLKYVVCPMTNTDHIDSHVPIISLKGETKFLNNIWSTAEHTIHLMLSLVKKTTRTGIPGRILRGKTILIWGYGRVGKQVATLCKAFGMKILAVDKETPQEEIMSHLSAADFVSIHVSVDASSKQLIHNSTIRQMKQGVYLINTSRPIVIDELALNGQMRRLGGYATDFKPLAFLRLKPNILYTEHTGGYCKESLEETLKFCWKKYLAIRGEDNEDVKRKATRKKKRSTKRIKVRPSIHKRSRNKVK